MPPSCRPVWTPPSLTVLRDAVGVPGCSGAAGTASPDPCVGSRVSLGDGDIEVIVLASGAGTFNFAISPPGRFHPVTPARILDTRDGTGQGGSSAKVAQASSIILDVTGPGGVPTTGVSAVVLNVTATAGTAPSYITVYSATEARSLASNLNLVPGEDLANLATVKVGTDGNVRLYNNAGPVHLVADVVGFFVG